MKRFRQSIFCLVLICLAAPLYADGATGNDWLHTEGALIKDSSGNVVILRGVNMFIRLQNERAKFMSARNEGANVVRLCLWKCDIETPGSNDTGNDKLGLDKRGLAAIDDAIGWAHDAGLMVILEQHIWSEAVEPAPSSFLSFPTLQAQWLAMWRLLVDRYKNDPTVIGIDLMNEPYCILGSTPGHHVAWETIAENAVTELRPLNPNLLFFVAGWGSSVTPGWDDVEFLQLPNTVYTEHIYYDGAPLPLPDWELSWRIAYSVGNLTNGRDLLAQFMDSRYTVFTNQGIPVWIGEIGFITELPYWQHQMEDELELFDKRGIGYAAFVHGVSRWGSKWDIVDASYNLTNVGRVYSNHLTTPTATPITTPTATPITTPVTTPITTPTATPITTPVTTPITTPVTTPITTPVTTPITTPVTTPITTPVTTPITTPVTTPITTPTATPKKTPKATPKKTPKATRVAGNDRRVAVNERRVTSDRARERQLTYLRRVGTK